MSEVGDRIRLLVDVVTEDGVTAPAGSAAMVVGHEGGRAVVSFDNPEYGYATLQPGSAQIVTRPR